MSDFRIIITGGRKRGSIQDYEQIYSAFSTVVNSNCAEQEHTRVTVIQGGCPTGIDSIACTLAHLSGCKCETFPADFDAHPGDAVEVSNQAMVDRGASLCLAFPSADKSTGTWDMIRRACAAGIETRIYPESADDVA